MARRRNRRTPQSQPAPVQDGAVTHTTSRNETLWDIATQYYGTPLNWHKIQQANPNASITDHILKQNQTLTIPEVDDELSLLAARTDVHLDSYYVFYAGDTLLGDLRKQPFIRPPAAHVADAYFDGFFIGEDEPAMVVSSPFTIASDKTTVQDIPIMEDDDNRGRRRGQRTSVEAYDYYRPVVTLPRGALYADSAEKAQTLRHQIATFMDIIALNEAVNDVRIPIVTAGARYTIKQLMINNIPMAISELLHYHYGFNPGFDTDQSPHIDVVPGMRLRLQTAAGSPDGAVVSTGQFSYNVYRTADGNLSFNPFNNSISPPAIDEAAFTASMLETQFDAYPYYRILYPSRLASTRAGQQSHSQNLTLLGASTRSILEDKTAKHQSNSDYTIARGQGSKTMFSGRAWLHAEIPVTINGVPEYVPIGTTVQHVLSRFMPNLLHLNTRDALQMHRLHMDTFGSIRYADVVFDHDDDILFDVYHLPLLAHDTLTINLGTA